MCPPPSNRADLSATAISLPRRGRLAGYTRSRGHGRDVMGRVSDSATAGGGTWQLGVCVGVQARVVSLSVSISTTKRARAQEREGSATMNSGVQLAIARHVRTARKSLLPRSSTHSNESVPCQHRSLGTHTHTHTHNTKENKGDACRPLGPAPIYAFGGQGHFFFFSPFLFFGYLREDASGKMLHGVRTWAAQRRRRGAR